MTRRVWRPETDEKVLSLREAGLQVAALAERFGTTPKAMSARLKFLRMSPEERDRYRLKKRKKT